MVVSISRAGESRAEALKTEFHRPFPTDDEPAAFGVDDPNYPEGNIVKQFFYAFRPLSAGAAESLKPSVAS